MWEEGRGLWGAGLACNIWGVLGGSSIKEGEKNLKERLLALHTRRLQGKPSEGGG